MSTHRPPRSPEHILKDYAEAFRLTQLDLPQFAEYNVATEGDCLVITAPRIRNGADEELGDAFRALGNRLQNEQGFSILPDEVLAPAVAEETQTQSRLRRVYETIMGPKLNVRQQPHLIVLDATAPNITQVLASLEAETMRMQATYKAKETIQQEKQLDNAVNAFVACLPKEPLPQVKAKTIATLGKLRGELAVKYDIPETLAIGQHTKLLSRTSSTQGALEV